MSGQRRVLVTGASGFVGSHVAESLEASGFTVRVLVRRSSSLRFVGAGAEMAFGDVTEADSLTPVPLFAQAMGGIVQTLMGSGAPGGRFAGVEAPQLETTEHCAGERLRAVLHVPEAASYFDDHFPRRPVYPGTLLMDNLSTLALQLAGDLPALHGSRLAVARVRDVKIRSFTAPGQALELEAHLQSSSADGAQMKLAARADGRTIATARIDVERSR